MFIITFSLDKNVGGEVKKATKNFSSQTKKGKQKYSN